MRTVSILIVVFTFFSAGVFAQSESFDGQRIAEHLDGSLDSFNESDQSLAVRMLALGRQQATKSFEAVAVQWDALTPESTEADVIAAFGQPDVKHQDFNDKTQVYDYWYAGQIVGQVLLTAEGVVGDMRITGL